MADRSGRYILGAILILLGVIFLLPNLHLPLLGWANLWPLFIILFGLAFLAGWAVAPDHDPGLAFVGTAGLLAGVFFVPFAWGILSWGEMSIWWPAFPFLGGLSFLVLWAAGRAKEPGILVPACGGILTGLVAFAFTDRLVSPDLAARWWPVALIVLGVVALFGGMLKRK